MEWWQIGLLALGVAWLLQAVGTWWQMRHFRRVMGAISRQYADGHMGVGSAPARLGKGVILILVVGPDDRIRQVSVMEGRSVFAAFQDLDGFAGRPLAEVRTSDVFSRKQAGRAKAFGMAVEQIDRARARVQPAASDRPATAIDAMAAGPGA